MQQYQTFNLIAQVKRTSPGSLYYYGEVNSTDNPGRKEIIINRKTKYVERLLNSTNRHVIHEGV